MVGKKRRYALADSAQQLVGGFLLAGPFVVTEEVWVLARNMTVWHGIVTLSLVFAIGYGALYKADDGRDPDREADVAGIPLRFLSLMLVAFGSVIILAMAFAAPQTFLSDLSVNARYEVTAKAVSVGAIFSVVGAATADSVF
ncbi:DUF2391 family protein [Haladaptatus sp. DJG-WS-42]|uniref:DUF2391 family protein n=1 Tax=Haladaptatus sp. DJG-WS-42 TaxID=3120516 RepID=UPI0030D0509A